MLTFSDLSQGSSRLQRRDFLRIGGLGLGGLGLSEMMALKALGAFKDPRFKFFGDLPEDTFEAFLSAPVIARNRVVGVINVQHRQPHALRNRGSRHPGWAGPPA